MLKINVKAVVCGLLLVLFLDLVNGLALILYFGRDVFSPGLNREQLEVLILGIQQSSEFMMGTLILGSLSTMIAGNVAMRVGKYRSFQEAVIIGLVGVVLGFMIRGGLPLWLDVVSMVSCVPLAMFGAWLALKQHVQQHKT